MGKIEEKVTEYIITIPQLLALLVFSFLNGYLYSYIITTYIKKSKKGNKKLESKIGNIALGLIVHAVLLIPLHYIYYHKFPDSFSSIMSIVIQLIIVVLLFSVILFILFLAIGAKNGK